MIRRLLIILGLVVAIAAIGDLLLRAWVESRIESSAEAKLQGVASVRADIDGYPFLPRLVATGEITGITIELDGLAAEPIDVASIRLDVDGIRFDRTDLFFDSRATITDVEVVRITAVIGEDTVRALTGLDVDFGDGRATIRVAGRQVVAAAAVRDGALVFDASPLSDVSVPIPGADLLPCTVEGRIVLDALEFTCTTDRLPPLLVRAIGSIDLREAVS